MPENNEWLAALPDDLKTDPNITKFKSPADLAKSYVEASKMMGNSIRPPGPDAPEAVRKEYIAKVLQTAPELIVAGDEESLFKRLGRPESEDAYTVDDATAAVIDLTQARAQAKAAGLTLKQFQALAKQTADAKAQAKAASEKEHAALKQEWGYAHADRVLAAAAAARKMGMPDTVVAAIAAGAVPAAELKLFYDISKVAGVDAKEITTERQGGPQPLTPAEAQAQMAELQADPDYWDDRKNPARHKYLTEKMLKLTQMSIRG